MKILGLKLSKKVIIGIVVGIVAVGGVTTGAILLNNNNDNKPKQEEKQKESVILNNNLEFEINSEVNLLSLVSEDNKVKIVSEDETIDTSTLGDKEITIKYLVEDKEEEKTFTIKIVDTQAPTIEYKKELSTNVGTKIDLLKDIKVSDNSKEEIKATIEGEYDFNKEGTYKLKYVAIEEEFTLIVNKKSTTSNNSKPQTNNNSNNNNNNTSNNIDPKQCETLFYKYDNMYKTKFTTKQERFSPEQYVTIRNSTYPYKWHYEWWLPTKKWIVVSDANFPVENGVENMFPAPSRDGKEIAYEENGITYYTGEKTQTYQAYGYSVEVDIPGVCTFTTN